MSSYCSGPLKGGHKTFLKPIFTHCLPTLFVRSVTPLPWAGPFHSFTVNKTIVATAQAIHSKNCSYHVYL